METPLSRTNLLREIRKMRFEEVYGGWQERRLTQEEAARVLGGYRNAISGARWDDTKLKGWTG